MSGGRDRVAGWLAGVAGAGGAGIAMLVCCATTAAVAGGGLAAAGGILRSPWLIVAGLVVAALAIAALVVKRTGRHPGSGEPAGADTGCCPTAVTGTGPAVTRQPGRR